MAYRPTGRAPGRPRGPVTPSGRLQAARKTLPHVRAFPRMRQAVDRALLAPAEVIGREWTADAREVRVVYRYTPAERGQILAFTWWVYSNRETWPRRKLKAAITAVSPLMLFSSAFLMEMTGMPRTSTQKCMIKAADTPVARVTGSCDMHVIHRLLKAAPKGLDEYRETVREMSVSKGVPAAMLSRISGVPQDILRRPDRGVQFFPEDCDEETGVVCTHEQRKLHEQYRPRQRRKFDPVPGDQDLIREVISGNTLTGIRATSAPVPGDREAPYHTAIPGLPRMKKAPELGARYYQLIREWEQRYQLPASPI